MEFGQLFADKKLPEARDRLTKAAEALRGAKAAASRTGDEDVLIEAAQELDRLDRLLRTMLQRPEFASLAGPGDTPPAIQTPPATGTSATTPRAAAPAQAVTEASPPVETDPARPVPAETKPGTPVRAAAPPLPPSVLTALGEIAGAEGDPAEAEYWFDRAEAAGIPDSDLAERIQLGRAVVWLDDGPTAQALAVLARISRGRGRWAAAAAAVISARG